MIDIRENDTEYLLTIPKEQKERARSIVGRDWDWKRRVWVYPRTNENYDKLISEFGKDLHSISFTRPSDRLLLDKKNYIDNIKINNLIIDNNSGKKEFIYKNNTTKCINRNIEEDLTIHENNYEIDNKEYSFYRITANSTGFSYKKIIGNYLSGCDEIVVEDPYIRKNHQLVNLLRFIETVVSLSNPKKITLITKFENQKEKEEVMKKISNISDSLCKYNICFDLLENDNLHDRSIRLNNGWLIKIGRGLDIYQKPDNWWQIGNYDLDLRPCYETDVSIIRTDENTILD